MARVKRYIVPVSIFAGHIISVSCIVYNETILPNRANVWLAGRNNRNQNGNNIDTQNVHLCIVHIISFYFRIINKVFMYT